MLFRRAHPKQIANYGYSGSCAYRAMGYRVVEHPQEVVDLLTEYGK